MASNISVSVTADATPLTSAMAVAKAEVASYSAAVRKAAQEVAAAGDQSTAAQVTALDKAVASRNAAASSYSKLSSAAREGAAATEVVSAAVRTETEAMNSNGVAREAMVLAHELMQGRFTRVGGSLMVMAERMGGASLATMGLVGAFAVAAMGAMHLVEWLEKVNQAKLLAEAGAIGSGITQAQADASVTALRTLSGVSTEEAGKIANAYLQMRGVTLPIMNELVTVTHAFAQRTGEDNTAAAAKIKSAFEMDAAAAGQVMEATRATTETTRAFQAAITNNDAVKARAILLQELARSAREVSTQTRAGLETESDAAQRARAAQSLGALPARAAQGIIDKAAVADSATATKLLADAIASVTAEMKTPAAQSWAAQTDLALQKATLETEQAAHAQGQSWQQIHQAMSATTVAFWQQQVQQTAAGTANNEEAQRHLLAAQEQVDLMKVKADTAGAKKSLEEELSSLTAQQAAYHDNFAIVMSLEDQKVALLRAAGSTETTQLNMELKRQADLVRQHNDEVFQLAEQENGRLDGIDRERLNSLRETLNERVALGEMTRSQEIAAEIALSQQLYAQDLKRLQDLAATLNQEPALYQKVEDQIVALTEKNTAEMAKLHTQAAQASEAAWTKAVAPVESAMDGLFNNMVHGNMTAGQMMLNFTESVVEGYAKEALQAAEHWAVGQLAQLTATETTETAKTVAVTAGGAAQTAAAATAAATGAAVSKASGLATITQDAYKAAAGAYASVSQIPYVGPVLAPAAAAAAFVAVEAFGVFDVGTPYVPHDMLAMVHQGEIIAPATMSDGIRSGALSLGGGGSTGAGGAGGGGDINVHFNVSAIDGASVAAFFKSNARMIASIVGQQATQNPSLRATY